MKSLLHTTLILLLMTTSHGWASAPPEGVSSEQWISIQQQIAASKYRPQPLDDGFYRALNAAQGWQVKHAPDGMTTIKNEHFRIGMKLNSIGSQQIAGTPEIEVKEDNLYYYHSPTIKEWWVNSADKTEQWFGLQTRPITGSHEIKVGIEIDTNTTVTQEDNQLVFTAENGQKINYDRLKVWDAHGTVLPSRMQLAESSDYFNLIVDDRLATYPITIDPSFTQEHYLKPVVVDAYDNFGQNVDIDNDILVVGTLYEDSASTTINGDSNDNSAEYAGAAYVFVREGQNWVQQAYLKASNAEADDFFGDSVAVSGNTVVVGARQEDGDANSTTASPNNNRNSAGAVYVYTRSGSTWTQQAYLKPHEMENDFFGGSVAIDGDTIVVGSVYEDGDASSTMENTNNNANAAGAAYVFTRSGNSWNQQAYLKASNAEASDWFGSAVAIDGDIIAVSAEKESGDANSTISSPNNAASESGAVYVFIRSEGIWSQQGYLKAFNAGSEDRFGYSIDISGDTIVVGSQNEDGDTNSNSSLSNNNAIDAGAAYVFTQNDGIWTQQDYLKAENAEAGDLFGWSVAVSGNTIAVGATSEDGDAASTMASPNNNAIRPGAVYVFARKNNEWQQKDYLKALNISNYDDFGRSVAIDEDNIVIGDTGEDGDANSTMTSPNGNSQAAGVVYVFKGRYFIGGELSGLPSGETIELIRDGTELLNVSNNGSYEFPTDVSGYGSYVVSFSTTPQGITCSLVNATGSVNYDDVTDANVYCSTNSYSVSTTVSGLTDTGLVLRNNGIYDLIINTNGNYTFSPEFADGMPYDVVVQTQPSGGQTCSITNGSGTINGSDIVISVVCVGADYDIGGMVSGLSGTLVLQNNGGDDLSLTNNGSFTFDTPVTDGNPYAVTVQNQPNAQTCVVTDGSGIVSGADVTDVAVVCVDNTYFIGGSVSGLAAPGLVLQNNGSDDLNIMSNGGFVFDEPLNNGSNYAVSISTAPNSQTCSVSNGAGTVAGDDVIDVMVNCADNTYLLGVNVSGLTGPGLTLQNNGGDDLTIISNGVTPFATELSDGDNYNVTIATQPNNPENTCETAGVSSGVIDGNNRLVLVECGNDLIYNNGFE